jgi:transcriptional regulator with XRE-family HTH domain
MTIANQIRARRLSLGKSDTEIATLAGLSIYEYGDVEQHADEFLTALPLRAARKLCTVLQLDILQLINREKAKGANCRLEKFRGALIREKRLALGQSVNDIAEHIGFADDTVISIETIPEFLDSLPIQVVLEVADRLSLSADIVLAEDPK